MTREQIMQKLQEEQVRALGLAHTYDGIKRMFDGAAMVNDSAKCDEYRFKLHTLLDAQLDAVASTMMLTRAFMEAEG